VTKETPLIKQYKEIKSQYPDTLLFFRLGDFYELFDDDAVKASKLMEITLTKRQGRPMCGIPYHAASTYIKKILNKSVSVAICEQVEDPSQSKGIVKREVVRVITPGTVIEDDLLLDDSNNFLAAVYNASEKYGVVFLDVSTGDFTGCQVEDFPRLLSEITGHQVKEAVIPSEDEELEKNIKAVFPEMSVSHIDNWYFSPEKAEETVKDYFELSTLKGWELDKARPVLSACGGLVKYIEETQKGRKISLKNFSLYSTDDNMVLDRNTLENLELLWNMQDGSKTNTLFDILDNTESAMGKRKLRQYILRPLKDEQAIRNRHNAVEELMGSRETVNAISQLLSSVSDMERILSKTSYGSSNARDLLGLKDSLKLIPEIKKRLEKCGSDEIVRIREGLSPLDELADDLERAIKESPPLTVKEGNIIRKGYSKELDELIEISSGDKKWIAELEQREKKRLDIPSLKVGYNKVYGYYIEVTKTHSSKVPEEYQRKQTLVNSERYITEELKKREDSILGAEEKKCALEYRIFCSLREKVALKSHIIQENAGLIAELDVLNSFAVAAHRYSYVKPGVGNWNEIVIKDGRHPVVEASMGANSFIPNDTLLNKDENQILIITGPNMAGKSTYLKQVAIITIMAQMGSYVPASEARIGISDRVFTRIGAGENLAGGESTFMVEMTEVAAILNNATDKSLLIMDEVGRGTSTFDGISIAWSVIERIAKIGARTLFATHYFELTELQLYMDCVKNYNFAVREWKDKKKIVFLRKLQEGSADKSYGIHCAELAGVPADVIGRAWQIFRELEEEELNDKGYPRPAPEREQDQLNFFGSQEADKYRKKLKDLNLNSIAPLDLVNIIRDWQEEIENEKQF